MTHMPTPEPYFLPGYGGHCPETRLYVGDRYARVTHKAILSTSAAHGSDINLSEIHETPNFELERDEARLVMEKREKHVDSIFSLSMVPGYTGSVPRLKSQVGKSYTKATMAALVEHEKLMEEKRCYTRNLIHSTLLNGAEGRFERKTIERMMPRTQCRAPLIPIDPRRIGLSSFRRVNEDDLPYSKCTPPHFMANDDKEKFILEGYTGHIPNKKKYFGISTRKVTRKALNEFSDNIQRRHDEKICGLGFKFDPHHDCNQPDCDVYRNNCSIPTYGGHVPGRIFQVGKRTSIEMKEAKDWLRVQKLTSAEDCRPQCGAQWR